MRTGQEAFLTNIFFPGLRVKEFLECEIFGCTDNRITEQGRRFFSETKYLLFSWLLSSSLPFCMGKDSSNVEPFDTERAEQDRRLIWSVGCTSCEVYISNLTKENPFLQILKQCSRLLLPVFMLTLRKWKLSTLSAEHDRSLLLPTKRTTKSETQISH